MLELLGAIFSMSFDIIIPLSFCLIAFALALIIFCIRYFSYARVRRKYKDKVQQQQDPVVLAVQALEGVPAEGMPAEEPKTKKEELMEDIEF